MTGIVRVGDMQSGHQCFAPTPAKTGCNTVLTNGKPTMCMMDPFVKHACGPSNHDPHGIAQVFNVLIGGKPPLTIGCMTDCGATIIMGSGNVIAG